MEKKKRNRYTVQVKLDLLFGVEVLAESIDDALVQAKAMDVRDIVTFTDEYLDGEIKVTGVFE